MNFNDWFAGLITGNKFRTKSEATLDRPLPKATRQTIQYCKAWLRNPIAIVVDKDGLYELQGAAEFLAGRESVSGWDYLYGVPVLVDNVAQPYILCADSILAPPELREEVTIL